MLTEASYLDHRNLMLTEASYLDHRNLMLTEASYLDHRNLMLTEASYLMEGHNSGCCSDLGVNLPLVLPGCV